MVIGAYVVWYEATGAFNPNPKTTTLDTTNSCSPSSPPCPVFRVDSANLTVRQVADITSQEITLRLSVPGPSPVGQISVYFSGVPIGNMTKTVPVGQTLTEGWAIPTTFTVTAGSTYTITIGAFYLDPSSGRPVVSYWNSLQAVAT